MESILRPQNKLIVFFFSTAGTVSTSLTCPLEVLKVRMQSSEGKNMQQQTTQQQRSSLVYQL